MSELIAEARVLVTPDTTTFRALLETQLAAITKTIPPVPVTVTPVVAGTAAGATGLVAAQKDLARNAAVAGSELAKEQEIVKGASAASASAAAATKSHARELGGLSKGAGSAAASMLGLRGATLAATGPFIAGAAAAITFAKSVSLAADFQKQLAVLQATSGATADQLKQVSEAAKQLGADVTLPAVSAVDAAQAMTELSKAGLSVQDSIDGARGVLQLATAAAIDNAAATELAASAINAFGLAGSDAGHVADVFANAANAAQGSIENIAVANQQASAAARQAGLTFEETTAILTEFARAGIKSSDAGTSLRVLLLRLINPSKQANEVIEELGLHLRDATGNINLGFFDEFARKTQNLTRAERDRDAAIIAGQDGFRGLSILARTGAVDLQLLIDGLNKSGTAAELAAARTTGLSGATENLKNQLSTVGLSIGQSLTPSLTGIVDGASAAVTSMGFVVEEVKKLRAAAETPIDFIINVIPEGGGGGEGGFLGSIKGFASDLLTKPLPGLIALGKAQKGLREETAAFNAEIARARLPQFISDLNKIGATPEHLNDTVKSLQDMAKSLEGGDAKTEAFRKSIEAFIAQLQTLSAQPNIELPITLPAGILDGTFGQKAAKSTALGFANQLKNEDFGFSGFVSSVDFSEEGSKGGKLFGTAWAKSMADAIKALAPASGSALGGLDLAVAQATGTTDQQLSILRQQQARQEAFLDAVLGRDKTAKNVALAQKAADNLAQTNAAIKSILDARAAAAKQAASAAESTAREQAAAAAKVKAARDKAFLQAQEDARDRQQRLITLADDTPALNDDIRRQEQNRVLLKRQIAAVKASALDQLDKAAAIRALKKAQDATTDELKRLHEAQKKQQEEQRQQAADQRTENLSLREQIAEARGNKDAIVTALDAQISDAQKRVVAAKKAKKGVLEAILALEQLKAKKRDLLKTAKEAADDRFSGFEFLQKTQGFAANLLGNLIPGFATGGLVGNTSSAAVQGQITDPRTAMLGDDVVTGNRLNDRGVRPVQVDTTNALLRQILAAVSGRHTNPPEIRQNWRTAFAELDTL